MTYLRQKSKVRTICFFVSDISACGGTESVCLRIASELCKRGYEVHIISLTSRKQPFFRYDTNIKFHTLLDNYFYRKLVHKRWFKAWRIDQLIDKLNPDIVIDTTLGDLIAKESLGRGVRYISWVNFTHDYAMDYPPHRDTVRSIIEKNGNMVVLTNGDRQLYLKDGVGESNIRCIYNPLTIEYSSNETTREKKVVAVGRFSKEKGFDLLLRAWALVEKENVGWMLEIWGDDGRYEHDLDNLVKELELKSVSLHGVARDVREIMNTSSVYVLPSRQEGFGLVLLEASSCELPLIAFDCPNGPREIIRDGVNGILVPPENVVGLASAILSLIRNEKKRLEMGKAAYEMSKQYTVELITDKWEQLFQAI